MSIVRASFFMAFLRSCPVRDVFCCQTAGIAENKKAARFPEAASFAFPVGSKKAA